MNSATREECQVAQGLGSELREESGLRAAFDAAIRWRFVDSVLVGHVAMLPEAKFVVDSLAVVLGGKPRVVKVNGRSRYAVYGKHAGREVVLFTGPR